MKTIGTIEAFADRYDLAIVGAGPAGLAAASMAAALGVDVIVLDENASPGRSDLPRGYDDARDET